MVKLKPADKDAQAKFKECDKVVKALRFAKAISQPDEDDICVADSIDLSTMGASCQAARCWRVLTRTRYVQSWSRHTRAHGWPTTRQLRWNL